MYDSDTPLQYSQIESQLDTGDLFSFHSSDPIDMLIEMAEGGQPYTHVGMILKFQGELFFWDAPGFGRTFPQPFITRPTPDANPGCRVAPLRDLMAYYLSAVPGQGFFWRRLESGMNPDRYCQLIRFIEQVNGTPFPNAHYPNLPLEDNLGLGMALSYFRGRILGQVVTGSYYCAQLIADTWLNIGLLDPNGPAYANIPNAYTPADFDSTSDFELPLTSGTALSEVKTVHYDLVIDVTDPPGKHGVRLPLRGLGAGA